jgi:hypothetical protein
MGVFILMYVACAVFCYVKGNLDATLGFASCGVISVYLAVLSIDDRNNKDKLEAALGLNKELIDLNSQILSEAKEANKENREGIRRQDQLLNTVNILKTRIPDSDFEEINKALDLTVFERNKEGEWELYYKKDTNC